MQIHRYIIISVSVTIWSILEHCVYHRSPDKSHDKTTSNNLSDIREEEEQKEGGVQVVAVEPAPSSASKETSPQMDGQPGSQNHDSVTADVSNKEDAPATSSTNEERTDSGTNNGSPAVEGESIQRTDSGPQEDEGGIVQRSRTDSGPPPSEGDTITSFSSVKQLLSS